MNYLSNNMQATPFPLKKKLTNDNTKMKQKMCATGFWGALSTVDKNLCRLSSSIIIVVPGNVADEEG